MITLFTILIVISALVLILVVLIQKSKGGGLSSNFASSNAIMGVHKTTDFIEKVTWGLAGFIMILSIASVMMRPKTTNEYKSEVGTKTQEQPMPDFNTTIPTQPAPATATPAPASDENKAE